MTKIKTSIIIPVRTLTPYLEETIKVLKAQSNKDFETIVITDNKETVSGVIVVPSGEPTPAYKRNLGAKKAKGDFLAFLDDDSYPDKNWLKNALKIFSEGESVAGVCGPTLTPPNDDIFQKASGWVWSTWLGSGGAGMYRNKVSTRREVDDFPSVNLLIRKKDFFKVGGFDINHWPGEDTKLCLDIHNQGKKIIYDPSVLVYHHRRKVFLPHLKQISRYALRRGFFAKVFPQTSLRIGYLIPSLFVFGLIIGAIVSFFIPFFRFVYLIFLAIYLLLLFVSGLEVYSKEKSLYLSAIVILSIFATHLTYGFLFPIGFFDKNLKTVPHKIDTKKKVYLGG